MVFKRKSVRKYTDEKVPDEVIENLLKAGMQAPSACNQQAWEFIVVSDEEDKEAISKMHRFATPAMKTFCFRQLMRDWVRFGWDFIRLKTVL